MTEKRPNPGSPEAVALGCVCPVMDNHNGKGFHMGDDGPMFWRDAGCIIHGVPKFQESKDEKR